MNVKDRILKYLNSKGVAITKAEVLLGWSKGALLKANSVSSDRLSEFILQYPEINSDWLLTGNGPMLKTDYPTTVQQSERSANYQGTFTEPINTVIGSGNITGSENKISYAQQRKAARLGATPNNEAVELRHESEKLKIEIERLKAEIEHLKISFELKDSIIKAKDDMIQILMEKK